MKYKGIIFDFNGVLFFDTTLQEEAWKTIAKKLRGSPFSDDEMENIVHGRNNRYVFEYLFSRPLSDEKISQFINQKETIYRSLCLKLGKKFALSPGSINLLDWLVQHKIPHTIATASGKDNVDFFRKNLNLDRWFDSKIIVCDDGTLKGKPNPDIYLRAASIINLSPSDCVVVEDAKLGISSAHAAGIGNIIALSSDESRDRVSRLPGVSVVIRDLGEIDPAELFQIIPS